MVEAYGNRHSGIATQTRVPFNPFRKEPINPSSIASAKARIEGARLNLFVRWKKDLVRDWPSCRAVKENTGTIRASPTKGI